MKRAIRIGMVLCAGIGAAAVATGATAASQPDNSAHRFYHVMNTGLQSEFECGRLGDRLMIEHVIEDYFCYQTGSNGWTLKGLHN